MQAGMGMSIDKRPAASAAAGTAPRLPRGIAGPRAGRPALPADSAARPDAIDRAIARIRAGLPGSIAAADAAAVEAGANHLLALPRPVALRRIAERIYDPHGFALRSPQPKAAAIMLDDLRVRLAGAESPAPCLDPVWHERRSRRLAWQECRRALIAIIHDADMPAGDEAERTRQAALATQGERF